MADQTPRSLQLFGDCIAVMLNDGVLTREERRLITVLSRDLGMVDGEPLEVYEAVRDGKEVGGGEVLSRERQLSTYQNVYEVALIGSLSHDEWRLLAYLRKKFGISEDEHKGIEDSLKNAMQERYEPKVVDRLLNTLEDSVSTITRMISRIF